MPFLADHPAPPEPRYVYRITKNGRFLERLHIDTERGVPLNLAWTANRRRAIRLDRLWLATAYAGAADGCVVRYRLKETSC